MKFGSGIQMWIQGTAFTFHGGKNISNLEQMEKRKGPFLWTRQEDLLSRPLSNSPEPNLGCISDENINPNQRERTEWKIYIHDRDVLEKRHFLHTERKTERERERERERKIGSLKLASTTYLTAGQTVDRARKFACKSFDVACVQV